jgi:hypothetical protein
VIDRLARRPGLAQNLAGFRRRGGIEHREQQMLGADVLVLKSLGFLKRLLEDPAQRGGENDRVGAGDLGERLEPRVQGADQAVDRNARALEHGRNGAFLLLEERLQEVLGADLGMAQVARARLGVRERLLALGRQFFEAHGVLSRRRGELLPTGAALGVLSRAMLPGSSDIAG